MARNAEIRNDLSSGAVLLLLAVAYLVYNLRYPLDSLANPGPGAYPLAVGLLLAALGAVQLTRSGWRLLTRGAAGPGSQLPSPTEPLRRARAGRASWLMVGVLGLYLLVVSWIGFLASTFILVVICSKLMGSRGWGGPVTLAFGIALGCYVLFTVWLKVPLPTGRLL